MYVLDKDSYSQECVMYQPPIYIDELYDYFSNRLYEARVRVTASGERQSIIVKCEWMAHGMGEIDHEEILVEDSSLHGVGAISNDLAEALNRARPYDKALIAQGFLRFTT